MIEYQDEIDYLKKLNYYNYYEKKEKINSEFRQNYLNLRQKSASKGDKMIKNIKFVFNSGFNIFENKYSLEEFIEYDGIYYLCLLLEYFYQLLCKIQKEKINDKNILIKIEKNILENNKISNNYINNVNDGALNVIYQIIEKVID